MGMEAVGSVAYPRGLKRSAEAGGIVAADFAGAKHRFGDGA